ncbi:cobalamin biosynthesis protein [Thermomonospora umbrina]|uniref:Cobalamin biosynthesis protein CobD n=1 Tax=Thermomonospora umbrina TaxID=111806 RepID=A0A3D9SIL6_9ACTN|nr:cobalamin biosynthesis protein [Thermomonospora umbrina]REE95756.1 adenosylcobinamide-phosphate synthase [Thermomonospora umbrina]
MPRAGRAVGLLIGVALDVVVGDPRRGHPVAAFGRMAAALERRVHADDRRRGVVYAGVLVAGVAVSGVLLERRARTLPYGETAVTAVATWAVLGGTSLGREGRVMAGALEAGDVTAARRRLSHLCARDPSEMGPKDLARATVESVAENTSDAVVAPLVWGALLGVPGLLAYRAVNTLDAMVGYRNERYERFGWAAARLDDVANWVPARLTGLLTVLCAPVVGGSMKRSYAMMRRDGGAHPSPNAGRCEAAFAGALGVRLGGVNVYGGRVERRPELGEGPPPDVRDIRSAVRLSAAVTAAAAIVCAGVRGGTRAGMGRKAR